MASLEISLVCVFVLLFKSCDSDWPSFGGYTGGFSWVCGEELDLGSFCIQRTILDVLNLLFLSVFSVILVIGYIRKHEISGCSRRDWVSGGVSICCALTGIAYVSAGFWDLVVRNGGSQPLGWLVYFVRGLTWISLAVSLLVRSSKWSRILSFLWWLTFFSLVSTLNIEILVKTHNIKIFDIVPWLVNSLLIFCAFRNIFHSVSEDTTPDKSESEPLLAKKPVRRTEVGKISFITKLTFSWINPILCLGNSKPLVLEDVPPLASEDEAELAYQKFSQAWEWLCALLRTISGVFLMGCLIISKVVESVSQRHWFLNARRFGMRMRSALMVAVYQKQLKLSSLGRRRHSSGQIVNYIAVDAYTTGEFPWWFHSAWSYILQLFLSIGVLFGVVGVGALSGLAPLLVCGLLNVPFAKILQKCQSQLMMARDQRLRSTSEILNSMKVIKLQSWEDKFKNFIESLRDVEFKWLAEAQYKKCYNTVLYWMSPTIVSSVTFLGCALFGSAPLNASTIFTIVAALRCMGEPVRMIPEAISVMIQAKISFERLNAFFLDDELKSEEMRRVTLPNSDHSVVINGGNFSWEPESAVLTLRDINLGVKRGQILAVCGPVGAGKSSFLFAILGEIPKISGSVDVFGSIAYVSQTSWIQSGTIRDNILCGKPMDTTKYEKAIKACALDKDINSFDHGDETEIGQRGLNMSGGQKQRIQLARALYNDAEIYLLDDPFSAVDAHTAAILFNDCVMAALRHKTVMLVTHQVEFLSQVEKILVLEGGRITQSGSYEELLTTGTAFEQLVNAHKNAITVLDLSNNEGEETQKLDHILPEAFWDYLLVSKGALLMFSGMIAQCGFVALQAASTYWLALGIEIPKISNGMLIGVYAGISTLSAVFVYLRSFLIARLGLKASKAFFAGFTSSIFNAPMHFFDSTPVGRILTRASSDLTVLDSNIPFSIIFVLSAGIDILTTIGIMASVTWPVLIVAIFAMVAAKYVQGYYLASARELIRINGTTKAPVMNYAAESSLGVVTIRAFNMVDRFFQNYLKLIDTDAKLFFYSNAAMEWLVLRIEALQNLTLVTAALLLVLLPKGYVAPGLVGLSLSYALALTGTQVMLSRWYCNLSNYMVSVERIKQFMHIPSEPPAIVDGKRPPSSWPSKGRIELQNLKIKYRPNSPLVLKGITCIFKEGTRVGVVGRTGSGKTTLISALFRLVEPESGTILVDGLDICSIGLKDLRMKLSIIPQEPTLFKGSIRTNLDPLGLYSENEIWKALEKCQLKATISSLPNLLDSSVSDEGENWSAGQRQLFCLGRVLLKRNRILVLDEATASIDSATDAILQRIIRQEFSNCTVITVAHRVPTVMDSDMVMVLSYGKLVEYDKPSNLMDTNSSFSKLVGEYWSSIQKQNPTPYNPPNKILIHTRHILTSFSQTIKENPETKVENNARKKKQRLWVFEHLVSVNVQWTRTTEHHSWAFSGLLSFWHFVFSHVFVYMFVYSILLPVFFQFFLDTFLEVLCLSSHEMKLDPQLRYPPSMAFLKNSFSGLSWMCGEELDMGSFCIQRSILDVLNLLFLSVFCVLLVIGSIRKHEISRCSRRDWVSRGVSICCALISIGYLSAGFWDLYAKNEGPRLSSWPVYFVRGLIWISLTVSLLVQRSKWTRILSSIWWMSFFLLVSALNIEIIVETHSIQIFVMVPWLVNFLLLFCAFRNICPSLSLEASDKSVSEPLLAKNPVKSSIDFSKSSFISKLTFSWINPLLRLGYSKPLVLEDIPSLTPEDEAELAYKNFAHAWELLQREKNSTNTSNLVLRALAKLSSLGRRRHSAGEIVNYIVVDAYRMAEFLWWFHSMWSYMLQLFLSIGVLFVVILKTCQTELMMAQDRRLRSTSEILNSMKVIKLQSWEDKFKNLIESLREHHIHHSCSTEVHGRACHSVKINAGKFSWEPESAILTLREVNLTVQRGHKIAICGPVGAGKSSLLHAILGEIPKISGTVDVFGSIAYVSQTSWIQSGTIRDNILYGKPMDTTKYEKAIKACALDKDINSFDHGDETEIGHRGLNMSGGQKQRMQLARAVYNDADIYLLDDPFSAVDAHTAAILFNECVMAALAHKTVILVTHQVMEAGQITQSGSYEELLTSGTAFEQLVNAHKNAVTVLEFSNDEQVEPQKLDQNLLEKSHGSLFTKENSEGEISMKGLPGVQLTEEEETEIGDVGWKPFLDYLLVSNGMLLMSLGIITQSGFIALQAASTYWLALGIRIPNISNTLLIGVYTAISTLSAVFVYFRSFCAARLGLKASKAFFAGFTNSIFNAPMLFFDSTPVGRILTRASSDFSVVDFDIPFSIIFVVAAGLELITTIGIMASVTWQVLFVAIFAMVTANYVQGYYLASARELIRINGTTKAPVMNYAAETSLGVVTIRAFKMVDRFFQNYLELIDTDAKLFFYSNAAIEWLVLRIEMLQNLTLVTAALLLVLLPKGVVVPGLVGLSLSYALALTGSQVFLSRWYCNLSNYIVSVERIKQFMRIPPEPPAIVEGKRPPSSWPSKGRIELQNLKIKYRPNAPLVLKGITCTFKEGTRVGVVGRTGSGKTTLISALFRLVEPESGKILIDGLDICSIGLKDLRMKLSIIPQEATLFKGSIRTNLDPLGLYSDNEIWEALEKCQLKATISSLPNLLDSSVSDEGENWSAGQRQLFCLGRVLLKRNRILVLDEATASIDAATDAILQRIIRQEFLNCTVITVAHRVPTVIDSDMVMVLSYGKLVEYDEPSNLMETNSFFSKLVAEYWSSRRRNSSQNFNYYK
ncbi:unnamed protein product, partial [Vitis vinifera]